MERLLAQKTFKKIPFKDQKLKVVFYRDVL